MKKLLRHFSMAVCILGAMLFMLPNMIHTTDAASLSELRNRRGNLSQNLNRERAQLNQVRRERSNIERELNMLDIEIDIAHMTLEHINEWVEWAHRELEILEEELIRAIEDFNAQHELFAARVRELNETDPFGISYLQILLNSASLADAMINAEMINTLTEHDRNLTDRLRFKQQYLEWKTEEVEGMRREFEALRYEQGLVTEELQALYDEKEMVFLALSEREAELAAYIENMEEDSRAIERLINQALEEERMQHAANNPFVGGEMLWPLPGISHTQISSRFGMRRHPITRRDRHHSGIDIRAPRGTTIVAANDGRVIFAGWQGSYGNLILVDHGGGIVTAYAHLSSFISNQGDRVTRGQAIGRVGSTGASTGNHLHFEVRVNGTARNPLDYLR